MIADTTLLSDRLWEQRRNERGAASAFMTATRNEPIRTTIISAGELAATFAESTRAWEWLRKWKSYPLHPGIAQAAADVDRTLMAAGATPGEK